MSAPASNAAPASRHARAGFTLVELMVAIGLTGVVAVGLYSLSVVASQTFQQQQRISEMQLRLRGAMEALRGDIQRAGYMSTPSSAADPRVCPRPISPLQGIELIPEGANPTHLAADNRFVNPVRLRLTGNYVNTDEYLVMAVQGNTVSLQHRTLAFGRVPSAAVFQRTFMNRMVRIQGTNGLMQFGQVIAANYQSPLGAALPTITLAQAPVVIGTSQAGCGLAGLGVGATIAPITTVEYRIASVAASQSVAYQGSAAFTTGKTDLVRTELNPTPGGYVPVAGTERIVAEYAVDFDVAAVVDSAAPGPLNQPTLLRYAFGAPQNFTALGASAGGGTPQRVRAVVVRLSVRDRTQDPEFGWVQRASARDPLTRFRVFPAQSGAARVRSATAEIELVNVAGRNLR